jgi:very-short-patch-repair endonuclease
MLDDNQDPGVDVEELSVGSTRQKIWLRCGQDSRHRWQITPNAAFTNLKRSTGMGCPYCAGKLVDESNSMLATEPELAKTFHPVLNEGMRDRNNIPIDLSSVTSGSNRVKFWWFCPVAHDHVWQATPHQRCSSGCPACDGKQISVTNSLATKHPVLAKQWHSSRNGELTPTGVTVASGLKVWWHCVFDSSHEWLARISDRTKKGAGCPHCQLIPRSRLEIILRHELEATLGGTSPLHKIQLPSGRQDCDIIFEKDRLIVEYDGAYWHRLKFERDLEKTRRLVEAGWTVIRIREEPLEIVSPHDVLVPIGSNTERICGAAVLAVSRMLQRNLDGAREYAIAGKLIGINEAEKEIADLLHRKTAQRGKKDSHL